MMLSLCHSEAVIPSDAMLDASMRAIFDGILALEAEKSALAELGIDVTPFTGKLICGECRSHSRLPIRRGHGSKCQRCGIRIKRSARAVLVCASR